MSAREPRLLLSLAAAALLASCGPKEEPKTTTTPAEPAAPARPEKMANGEPAAVSVKHVLVAFDGAAAKPRGSRTRGEGERLAYEVLARAKAGEEIEKLMREFSDDPGSKDGNAYDLVNEGVAPAPGVNESPRARMVKGFGDVAFRLSLNEIGFAPYDAGVTPHGYHIIKRVK